MAPETPKSECSLTAGRPSCVVVPSVHKQQCPCISGMRRKEESQVVVDAYLAAEAVDLHCAPLDSGGGTITKRSRCRSERARYARLSRSSSQLPQLTKLRSSATFSSAFSNFSLMFKYYTRNCSLGVKYGSGT